MKVKSKKDASNAQDGVVVTMDDPMFHEKNEDGTVKLIEGYRKAFPDDSMAYKDLLYLEVKFENLGLALKNGKSILSGVSGTIAPGRVTAIMGPSGAGKVNNS